MIFKPWVGDKYNSCGIKGKKILVLGESHYGDDGDEYEDFTCDVVKEWAIKNRMAFFTKIAKSILGNDGSVYLNDEEKADFWNSVAFYNYVQGFAGDGPRQRPSGELWESSKADFIKVINDLEPDICVVYGYELWGNLPEPNKIDKDINGHEVYVYKLNNKLNNKQMIAGCVAHPSGGLSYAEARENIDPLFTFPV